VSLRVLRVLESEDFGFADTASLWTTDVAPILEELCWTIAPSTAPEKARRRATHEFLGDLCGPRRPTESAVPAACQRPRFRVNVCNSRRLPPRITTLCGRCGAKLFEGEQQYALGPGTQEHIDVEVFFTGAARQPDLVAPWGNPNELNCPRNCHEQVGQYLLAGRGDFIDTCGFNFAGACGPGLVHLSFHEELPDGTFLDTPVDFDTFLSDEDSFRALRATTITPVVGEPIQAAGEPIQAES